MGMANKPADCNAEATQQAEPTWQDHVRVINILMNTMDELMRQMRVRQESFAHISNEGVVKPFTPAWSIGGSPTASDHFTQISHKLGLIVEEEQNQALRKAVKAQPYLYEQFLTTTYVQQYKRGYLTEREYWQHYALFTAGIS